MVMRTAPVQVEACCASALMELESLRRDLFNISHRLNELASTLSGLQAAPVGSSQDTAYNRALHSTGESTQALSGVCQVQPM